jgi:hypothetical protein
VSCLCNVHELSFKYCDGIRDVSSLGRVHHLELSYCDNISDVSALGNVHTLNLDETNVNDVSALKNVYELHLERFQGNNLTGLENVEKLFLNKAHDSISDISMLKTVKELHVDRCPLITDFHGLNNLRILEISALDEGPEMFKITAGLEIFENLVELQARYVNLFEGTRDSDNSEKFLSLTDVPKVQTLILDDCVFSHFPIVFTHLLSLSLIWCTGFSFIPGFPS